MKLTTPPDDENFGSRNMSIIVGRRSANLQANSVTRKLAFTSSIGNHPHIEANDFCTTFRKNRVG